jgi:hypothetical protein
MMIVINANQCDENIGQGGFHVSKIVLGFWKRNEDLSRK